MRKFVVECDGCGKPLRINKGDKNAVIYHELMLDFRTFMIDPNTSMEEEVSNMARQTRSVYCNDCFKKLADHMESFVKEVAPETPEEAFNPEMDVVALKIQSKDPDDIILNKEKK